MRANKPAPKERESTHNQTDRFFCIFDRISSIVVAHLEFPQLCENKLKLINKLWTNIFLSLLYIYTYFGVFF